MASASISARIVRLLLAIGLVSFAAAGPARADDNSSAVDEIVAVLKEKGLIDQATGDEILAKQAKAEATESAEEAAVRRRRACSTASCSAATCACATSSSGTARVCRASRPTTTTASATGRASASPSRSIPWALVGVRIVTDTTDYRSTNISVGENADFSFDSIFLDRAYAQFTLPDPGHRPEDRRPRGQVLEPVHLADRARQDHVGRGHLARGRRDHADLVARRSRRRSGRTSATSSSCSRRAWSIRASGRTSSNAVAEGRRDVRGRRARQLLRLGEPRERPERRGDADRAGAQRLLRAHLRERQPADRLQERLARASSRRAPT